MQTEFLSDFKARIAQEGLNVFGVALQQHGELIAAHQFAEDVPRVLHSLSKSFAAAGVGMAIDQGLFSVEDRVVDFFPEDCPKQISPELAAMKVWHLLTMSPGHDEAQMLSQKRIHIQDENWVRHYLSLPLDRMPGERFVYDSACTYLLAAIMEKVTGEHLVDYLMPRLFAPLGITQRPLWETCPRGITLGCAGLYLKTQQILPFGQMYLDGGVYKGQQVVPASWVQASMQKQIDSDFPAGPDWRNGYGYQFWLCQNGAVRGSGANSQYCIIWPEKDAVIAVTSNEPRQQAVLDAVWACIGDRL